MVAEAAGCKFAKWRSPLAITSETQWPYAQALGLGFRGLGFRVPRVLSLGFRTFFDRLAEGCP